MNREIKFRAWDHENFEMLYVGDESNDDIDWFRFEMVGGKIKVYSYEQYFECGSGVAEEKWHWVEKDFKVTEYTGLKDKNGKEIYEGDIVQRFDCDHPCTNERALIGVVTFTDGSFDIENEKQQIAIPLFSETAEQEIIGNIFENPELLEG